MEAKRLLRQMVELLETGEHLGVPTRSDHEIVVPVLRSGVSASSGDAASMRVLLRA